VTLTEEKKGYFYHMTETYDMNNDGRLDVLTARATLPIISKKGHGELLWLE